MVEKEHCTGCGACKAVCPQGAIVMHRDWEGFLYPRIKRALCTHCGLCTKVCPITKEMRPLDESVCFGAKAKDERVRDLGSSGGVFPLLAASVLRSGGTVWGAELAEDGVVRHIEIHTEEDISRISRAKYVQSDLSRVWDRIKPLLQEGNPVLFCGTPCQTDALRVYLGKDWSNLFLVDIICYGVPSPVIWKNYVKYLESRLGGEFHDFRFRDKRNRDNGHTCMISVGEQEYTYSLDDDLYCWLFFRNINIRPACFRCRYCTTARNSDITLGDFWGIELINPNFDDGYGSSVVICHTSAGQKLWSQIQNETQWFVCDRQMVVNDRQPRLREPAKAHAKRQIYLFLRRLMPFPLWLWLIRRRQS